MKYEWSALRSFAQSVLQSAGMASEDARICADCLVTADARGVRSHGLTHLGDLLERIEHGTLDPAAKIEIVQTAPSVIRVNGNRCAGMVSAFRSVERLVELARETGIAAAVVSNANTYGLGAYYPMYAAEREMIGLAVCNTKAYVAPFGGADKLLGTDPISIAIPGADNSAVVVDMATSRAAVNQIALAQKEGRSIPDEWAVGPDGLPTADPLTALAGALLSFGGYKGYALQLVISLLSFALAGGDMDRDIPRAWAEPDKAGNFGCFLCVLNIAAFTPPEHFRQRTDALLSMLKSSRPAEGSEGVRIPGERSAHSMERARAEGVSLSETVAGELELLGNAHGVAFPHPKSKEA